ncbi:two-component sensor histidine kinase [Mucilaginibacter sp. SG538B]|uniref:tetratricopeptide repeat-containing sensor histidine kinase n=1 Tax=Mucilaginibacter sp. SG538B TaxID=2587021 RepID=UPI00159DC75F|nr:histidine kinase dimerization/phosphoacceptor domain -containing protein [Mucilaginibacter sp. SG538B]NVM66717.1 two-component sensor histidine kinase [Mucilaginibacter sp. SG538B]
MEHRDPLKRLSQRGKLTARLACAVLGALFFGSSANGQANLSGYREVSKQRLLLRITAQYLHTVSQGQIDMDSAILIPSKLYKLSPFLAYNEGYSNGERSTGTILLDAGKVSEAIMELAKSKGETRLRLLVELATHFLFKPGNAPIDLKEAAKYINEALSGSSSVAVKWQIEIMSLKGELLQQSGQSEESRNVFREVIRITEQLNDKSAQGRALLKAGGALHYGDPERLADFEKALDVFRVLGNKEKVIETISQIIIENFAAKRYDNAERLSTDIIQREKEIGFHCQQYSFDALSYINNRKGQLTKSLEYSNQSLEAIHSGIDSAFIGYFYCRRGAVLERLLKNQEAMLWFDKALNAQSDQLKLYWFRAMAGKVELLISFNRPLEAIKILKTYPKRYVISTYFEQMHYAYLQGLTYDKLHNFKLAETNYQQFLIMAKAFPIEYVHDELPLALYQITTFYRERRNTKKARELLEQARGFTTAEDLQGLGLYYQQLFKIDSTEKRYFQAVTDLQKAHTYFDSAFSDDQVKKARELLVKYETEKKDKNIKLLNSQKQMAQIRAREANRTINIVLGGLALLATIVALLIKLYFNKQGVNLKLEANRKELDQKNTFLEKVNSDKDKLLKEKEWLLKEVHHRVKNNLQMVTSLLYSQAVYLEDGAAKLAVNDSLRRMQAMSLIHQKLYQDQNTSFIAIKDYINDLVRYLHDSLDAGNNIVFKQQIEELLLDVSQAIPLGLIVTESIVNALKYAFLNEQEGLVKIVLLEDGPGRLQLKISDNGVGLPADFDALEHNSLGLDLMQGLANQLNGELDIKTDNGVHITLKFKMLTN